MSLWNKKASEIVFSDVDTFCNTMQPEGVRLDYKGIAFPSDLAKTIAAFANTLGGLIILGVDADKKTNMPIWPPQDGMPFDAGISERVISIANEAIYPPVSVAVSNVIENESVPGKAIVVIRINASRLAPHATEKNRRVYVYDRTENKNAPYELADLTRIESMLKRRQAMVDQRESELVGNIARAQRHLHRSKTPIRWMSVSPVYPWQTLCDVSDCVMMQQLWQVQLWDGAHWSIQQFTNGSFALGRSMAEGRPPICTCVRTVSANGTMFGITYASEAPYQNKTLFHPNGIDSESPANMMMNLRKIREMVASFAGGCDRFYKGCPTMPGEVMVSIGIMNAFDLLMYDSHRGMKSNAPFPDNDYRIDVVMDSQNLFESRSTIFNGVLDDIAFAFNAHAISS